MKRLATEIAIYQKVSPVERKDVLHALSLGQIEERKISQRWPKIGVSRASPIHPRSRPGIKLKGGDVGTPNEVK